MSQVVFDEWLKDWGPVYLSFPKGASVLKGEIHLAKVSHSFTVHQRIEPILRQVESCPGIKRFAQCGQVFTSRGNHSPCEIFGSTLKDVTVRLHDGNVSQVFRVYPAEGTNPCQLREEIEKIFAPESPAITPKALVPEEVTEVAKPVKTVTARKKRFGFEETLAGARTAIELYADQGETEITTPATRIRRDFLHDFPPHLIQKAVRQLEEEGSLILLTTRTALRYRKYEIVAKKSLDKKTAPVAEIIEKIEAAIRNLNNRLAEIDQQIQSMQGEKQAIQKEQERLEIAKQELLKLYS